MSIEESRRVRGFGNRQRLLEGMSQPSTGEATDNERTRQRTE